MRFHSQNLNEKGHGRVGWMLRHGRCWWKVMSSEWRFEWVILANKTGPGIGLDLAGYDDDAVGGHISLGWIGAFYWGFQNRWLRKIMERVTSREDKPRTWESRDSAGNVTSGSYWSTNGRQIGIRWFEGSLWIDLWDDPMESRGVDPRWWHISWTPADTFFGRRVHSERTLETRRVQVPMPERGYWAKVELKEERWQRPRLPWGRVITRAHIEMEKGEAIPFPGKGENAYDCGEDATFSWTGMADSVTDGIRKLTASVMKSRVRHGGNNWTPTAIKTA